MSKSRSYLIELQARGRIAFTTEEFARELSLTPNAAKNSLRRLRKKREIASPLKGFHIVLSPGDRVRGCRPPEEFIDSLMKHLGESYYVALLSAAEIHGAAHHRPQCFQVMVSRPRRMIKCGHVRIQFLVKRKSSDSLAELHKVATGYFAVSTPEVTAFDLIAYQKQAAGIDNIATVLSDLSEVLAANKLIEDSKKFEVSVVQRLGYILARLGAANLADALEPEVKCRVLRSTLLVPGKEVLSGSVVDKRWRVIINDVVQPDL